MRLSKIQLAVLSLIVANLIWGATPPIFKWSLQEIQPFTLAFLRFALAAAILYPFARKNLVIQKEDRILILFMSVIGLAFHIAYAFVGLKLSSSINAPMIFSAAPIFIIIGSTIFLHEKVKKKIAHGITISIIGVLIIVLRPLFENGLDSSLVGNIFFIISMGLSVFYTLMLKEIAPKYKPLTLTFWIFTITALTFLPLTAIEITASNHLFNFGAKSIIGIFFGAVLASVAAYSLQVFALKHIQAHEVAVFSYIDPVIAILIARPLLGETITTTFLIGSALIFVGIFIAEGRLHYHPIHLLKPKPRPQLAESNLTLPPKQNIS